MKDNKHDIEMMKTYLTDYVQSITTKAKNKNFICPLCGSGTGKKQTSAFNINKDGKSWRCFVCNESGDIFDLIGKYERLDNFTDQLKRASEFTGISIDNNMGYSRGTNPIKKGENFMNNAQKTTEKTDKKAEKVTNYSNFFLQANSNIEKTDYHRGLSLETLNRFKIGYVENWKSPNAPQSVPLSPRLIIPTSESSYFARDTRANLTEIQERYSKQKVGATHIFNINCLETAKKPIFIVEGEIDALSIIDVGGIAVGLGSVSTVNKFIEELKKVKLTEPLIIALDNDKSGKKGAKDLESKLAEMKIYFCRADNDKLYGDSKDANEALCKDREKFKQAVEYTEELAEYAKRLAITAENEQNSDYLKKAAGWRMPDFRTLMKEKAQKDRITTGFEKLDKVLGGGLYEGLYIIGAISSLGKTTFTLQVADQIARMGDDVLIFSLEMPEFELMAKSISRETYEIAHGNEMERPERIAKSARELLCGIRYKDISEAEENLIDKAIMKYCDYAERIFIFEGMGDFGVEQVRKAVTTHINITGKLPVVIVDYLQILAPYSERATDKQNTDKAITELKRISRDFKIPVIGISSFNRANYSTKVSMESFKESGAIEYASDVLIGLQYAGAGKKDFDINKARRAFQRDVELVVLKNRNGIAGETIKYKYIPMYNQFCEVDYITEDKKESVTVPNAPKF